MRMRRISNPLPRWIGKWRTYPRIGPAIAHRGPNVAEPADGACDAFPIAANQAEERMASRSDRPQCPGRSLGSEEPIGLE